MESEQDMIRLIDNLNPRNGSIPSEWENAQAELLSMIRSSPSLANNSEIICSIIIFASKLTDSNALRVLTNCISRGIGNFHSLWFSSIALVLERQGNFISALSTFEQAVKIHVEPYPFLELKYSEFKKRMNERFQLIMNQKGDFNSTFTLDLGTLDGINYIFNNGTIITKQISNEPHQGPIIDVFKLIGFNSSSVTSTPMNLTAHNSQASINISSNAKQENYVCGFNLDLLTGPDDKECSFEEQRLLSIGINFIENRKLNTNINSQQSNPDSPIDRPVLPKKPRNRKPLQPLDQLPQQQPPEPIEGIDSSFSFNDAAKPRSILKKSQNAFTNNYSNNNSVSINKNNSSLSFINSNNTNNGNNNNSAINPISVSPRNSRSGLGVTFGNSAALVGSAEKRRSPTPIPRHSSLLLENETIDSGSKIIGNLIISSKIGDRAYLAKPTSQSDGKFYVVKRLTYSDAQNHTLSFINNVQHEELFALQADPMNQSPDFFITNYYSKGSLEDIINALRAGEIRADQKVSLFFLLQMILILQQLEMNKFIHGEINGKNLLIRTSTEQLSKKFGLNEPGWKETGIVLIRCDQIQNKSSPNASNLQKVDRASVYNLFIDLSIMQNDVKKGFVQYDCPKAWNKSIWKMTFDTLSTNTTLDPLISLIFDELESNFLILRSKISSIFVKLLK